MALYDFNGDLVQSDSNSFIVKVAAFNSTDRDRQAADYVCSGQNDQTVIQQAVDSLSTKGGVVQLANGDYSIDGWSVNTSSVKTAIAVKSGTQRSIKITGMSFPIRKINSHDLTNSAILRVSATALSSLTGSETASVIGYDGTSRSYPSYVLDCENIGICLADNQHKVTAINGKYFSAMFVKNAMFGIDTSSYSGIDGGDDYDIPVDGCVAIRGLDGSNFGAGYRLSNCFAFGFGVAYDLCGEHLIAEQLGCRFCKYSYRFRYNNSVGANYHDQTLINCCHEICMYYPKFYTTSSQAVNFYDYNTEDLGTGKFALVERATEETPGSGRGRVYYTAGSPYAPGNGSFFETGNGANFDVKNTFSIS